MNQRPERLVRACPFTRVEYLENVGWSRVLLPVYPKAGDVVVVESELCYTDVSFRQSELAGYGAPWFFWGVYDTPTWYAGGSDTLYSQQSADTDWHVFKLVSLGEEAGLWVDGQKIIDIIQYPDVVYAPQGIELWSYSNGRRNSLNRKKWLRITINGKEVMHLLPVLDDGGSPALYDTVSRQLFYNSGEDNLVAGPVTGVMRYTPVEYIESAAGSVGAPSAYFLLPVFINYRTDSFAIETEHAFPLVSSNQAEGSNDGDLLLFYGYQPSGRCYYGIRRGIQTGPLSVEQAFAVHRIEYDTSVMSCYVNGELNAKITPTQPSSDLWLCRIGVFVADGIPIDGVTGGNSYPFNGKKKYYKLWVNGKLLYHLIPVVDSTGVPCMYDVVNSRFYYSEGETDFIAGPMLGT